MERLTTTELNNNLFEVYSGSGVITTFDRSLAPSEGELVLYMLPCGAIRSAHALVHRGKPAFDSGGALCPFDWVEVLGVAVDITLPAKQDIEQ